MISYIKINDFWHTKPMIGSSNGDHLWSFHVKSPKKRQF